MIIDKTEQLALWRVAEEVADAARAVTLPLFRSGGLVADNKASGAKFDPVTVADRNAERAMREVLARLRPDDGVLGEEEPPKQSRNGLTWVLDPIDGTRAFISGLPTWGILIGLDAGNGPLLGMIDQPYTDERFVGGFGEAALIRGGQRRPISVRTCADLADATLYSTFPEVGTANERQGFEAVSKATRLTRYGTDCYGYALVALGQIDLVIEAGLNPYDVQGPIAVIEGAGGIVTDWQGGPAHKGGRILAAGDRRVHAQALAHLSKVV